MWMQTGMGILPGGQMWSEALADAPLEGEALLEALGVTGILPLALGDLQVYAWPLEDVGMWKYQAVWRVLARTPRGWCVHLGYGGSVRAALAMGAMHFVVQARRLRAWLRRVPAGAPAVWEDDVGRVWRLEEAAWVPRGCVCFDVEDGDDAPPDEAVAVPGRAYSGVGAAERERGGAVVAVSEGSGAG